MPTDAAIAQMLRKLVRTAQNYFPGLAEAKNEFYHLARKHLGFVHERDFSAIALLPRGGDDLFVDIGANRGQSILSIRHYRPDARIVCFEPNPVMFAWLLRHFGDDAGIRLLNVGVSAEPKHLTLTVPSYRGFLYDGVATFSKETVFEYMSADRIYGFDPSLLTMQEFACETRPLDSFDLQPTFIKIDVEGFEHEVIAGGMQTLRRCRPVLMVERFYENPKLLALLDALGYGEVIAKDGRLRPGASTGPNMLLMSSHAAMTA